jgi:hypothetical protein
MYMLNDIQLFSTFCLFFLVWYLPEHGVWQNATTIYIGSISYVFAEKSLYFLTSSPFVSLFDETLTIMSRVRIIVKSDSQLHHISMSFCLSVCLASLSSVYQSFPMFFNSLYCIIIFLKTQFFFAFWRFSVSINTLQKDLQKFCTIVPEVRYL